MRSAGLILLAAAPGAALGYLALTGYLLTRIKPVPITHLPWVPADEADGVRETAAI